MIAVLFRPSPSMSDVSVGQDVLVDISLYSEVHDIGCKLSSLLGIPAYQLWMFHNGALINGSNNNRLRWTGVHQFLESPVVFYYRRKGPPRSFDRMCLVELESLQRRRYTDVLALGRYHNPNRLTKAELEYLRVYCAVIAVQEREKDLQKALEKAVWRYTICSRHFIGPSLGYIKAVAASVRKYAEMKVSSEATLRRKALKRKGRDLASGVASGRGHCSYSPAQTKENFP